MLLAGDVGGTRTRLGLFARAPERPIPIEVREFPTQAYDSLVAIVDDFLSGAARRPGRCEHASIGVAGPVRDQMARLANVPWSIDAAEVAERLDMPEVTLINDLEALAHAIPVLEPDELAVLQEGEALAGGNAAVIAAGTGLGEALLHNVDGRFLPLPSEGGHADFAARTPRELALVAELTRTFGRAQNEHVISGPGLVNIHRFLHAARCPACDVGADLIGAPAAISRAALEGRCPACVETLEMFVSAYGAEAGNLALRGAATAGVYVGGGIAPEILPALESGAFLDAFRSKDPMVDFLAAVPVLVILNRQAGLLGAAVHANGASG